MMSLKKKFLAALVAGLLHFPAAMAAAPDVSITLGNRHGHVHPIRCGCNHTGGGNIDVQQPSPDTIVITMSGVAVATPHPLKDTSAAMDFTLEQCFEISFDNPKVKTAKITVEGTVIGLLRSPKCGKAGAEYNKACAIISPVGGQGITLCVDPHGVGCGENLGINDHAGPLTAPAIAGQYNLNQTFYISANAARGMGKASSAEFADGALDPLWISYKEPFKGASKKNFGFQVTIKVVPDEIAKDAPAAEPAPAPVKISK